jgi:hypothetical protein
LEDETTITEDLLADPLRLSERDRLRLERRLRELVHLRSERYDARLSTPLPRYRALESGLEITTNGDGHPIIFDTATAQVGLYIDADTQVGHLLLRDKTPEAAHCLLPWAEQAILRGAARLAFEVFGARALQLQRDADLSPMYLKRQVFRRRATAGGCRTETITPAGRDWYGLRVHVYPKHAA